MQALQLRKKYPEVSQDEMFDLINRFKCVHLSLIYAWYTRSHADYGALCICD